MGYGISIFGDNSMNFYEIFSDYKNTMGEDCEAVINNADNALTWAKKRKKQGEIMKAQQSLTNKKNQLSDITKQGK